MPVVILKDAALGSVSTVLRMIQLIEKLKTVCRWSSRQSKQLKNDKKQWCWNEIRQDREILKRYICFQNVSSQYYQPYGVFGCQSLRPRSNPSRISFQSCVQITFLRIQYARIRLSHSHRSRIAASKIALTEHRFRGTDSRDHLICWLVVEGKRGWGRVRIVLDRRYKDANLR